ncbi:MBL fold metallo-hydrolase [Roseateles violae]|uniref:MBL fold metallo-hydrolase n=1 Tax=Roseateles violae TaxID=3058042 RepID=A0ABT8DXD9_9BURK|nr:MBL fold metallo-hydrolase [Pelomonas sp. PFR6]MDN3921889.1 MBL fold metallo-hydrolase [Pelomonas sp. PFR6]
MRFCSLGSGSGGNATLIEASQGITSTELLVDCGFSLRELTRRLARAGSAPERLAGVFITHEHGDHAGCALALARRHRVPIYCSRGTWRAIGDAAIDPALIRFVRDGEVLALGDLELRPFAVPHDANEPLQLRLSDGWRSLGLITDLGSLTPSVAAALQACEALLLECNHDEQMLRDSSYPASLKRRILGSHGHLSNAIAAQLLGQCLHGGLRHVVAAHLSERNNRPALAAAALAEILACDAGQIPIASQELGLAWLSLS